MTTLELFKKHRKGEVSRERFLYEVRRDNNLPWVTNTTSYDDAVKILKNKGIIREAQFEPQNITTDPAVDRANPYALKREVQKLLSKEKELTNDSYKIALNKAAKKIAGNPQAIKDAMFSNADSVAKADSKLQTKEVNKNNFVDKDNGMKKIKGQEAHKAMSAPTKENRKGKPKGVEVMPDKGVEGSQKIIKEIAEYIKKKLAESTTHDFHEGMEVETSKGHGKIKAIKGGTLEIELADGSIMDEQMNTVMHHTNKKQEEDQIPKEESKVNENRSFDNIEDAKAYAEEESLNGYVQHVQDKGTHFVVDDWYDSDETVASYENGMPLNEASKDLKTEGVSQYDLEQIQSHISTSSVLDIGFKEYALENLEAVDSYIEEEDFEEAIMELEELRDALQEVLSKNNPDAEFFGTDKTLGEPEDEDFNEFNDVYAPLFDKVINTLQVLADQKDNEEELEEFTTAKTKDSMHNAEIMKSIDTNVTNPIAKTQLKKDFNTGKAIDL